MTIYDAVMIAQEYRHQPVHQCCEKARAVCQARGVYPHGVTSVHGYQLDNWEAVIVESLLMSDIREEIMN